MTPNKSETTWPGESDARRFLMVLFEEPGSVVELRVPKPKGRRCAAAGYFDTLERLVAATAAMDGRAEGAYVTLNPVNPALLARAVNTVKCPIDATTTDADVVRRRWVLVDLDPIRPKGVSASESEHGAALARAEEIRAALAAVGWPEPLVGDSGNGAHLLYRVELPPDDGGLTTRVLEALAFRFSDDAVSVDRAVHNASRISKLYGTIAAKGDSTPERPHRRSKLVSVPTELRDVPREALERLAASAPQPAPSARRPSGGESVDVEAFLQRHGLAVARASAWSGGHRWILGACPWNPEHVDRSAYIVQFSSGAVAAGCLHASCQGKRWKDLRALLEPAAASGTSAPARATDGSGEATGEPVFLASAELRDLVPAVWASILRANDPPRLFVRGGQLVQIRFPRGAPPQLDPLTVDDAHGLIFRAGAWRRRTIEGALRPAHPPKDVARDLLSSPHPDLPRIEAVVTSPVFDADWTLVATPGFHPSSGLYLHLDGFEVPKVPERPSPGEVRDAVAVLEGVIHDFPFVKPSDRAHALAAFFLPFVRRAIRGPTPVHDIEAPIPGTGKSLLADLISRVAVGKPVAAATMPHDEDELRKKITAQLVASRPIVCFDNVSVMSFGTLAAAVTADPWTDRLLGRSQELVLPNRALWLVTANNPKLTTEIARRCVRVRIDPRVERPWERSGFRHTDIRSFVDANRGVIVGAILMLIRGWLAAGAPRGRKRLGSFESWSEVLGGILAFAEVSGFLEDRDELLERADQEGAEWRTFVTVWVEKLPSGSKTASELAAFCEREQLLDSVLTVKGRGDSQRGQATRLGKALAVREGRVFAGHRLVRGSDSHNSRALWSLERLEDDVPRPEGGDGSVAVAGHAGPLRDMHIGSPATQGQSETEDKGACGTCGTSSPPLTHVRAGACAPPYASARVPRDSRSHMEPGRTDEVPQVPQVTGVPYGTGESAAGHGAGHGESTSSMSSDAERELFEERAAIVEVEAGFSREDAERAADGAVVRDADDRGRAGP